jgi:protein associated with RNAse G/E
VIVCGQPEIGREVRVAVRKYDGRPHWHHTMRRLGTDEHGIWLGCPAGTVYYRGDEGPIYTTAEARVMLIPPHSWWTALYCAAPAECEVYCDITTPATWPNPTEVTMVDLDLDVWRTRPNGDVELLDQDEFAVHRRQYGYPPDVARRAEATAGWLLSAVSDRVEPFGYAYQRWLDEV